MTERREAQETVRVIDEYCEQYRELFVDVRSFEYFTLLHLGLISEVPRKSLPNIAKAVGLADGQGLHHFLTAGEWSIETLRERRLALTHELIGQQGITVCIDETGDEKKGKTTDYVARQYIGNLGQTENGMVSVSAYGVLQNVTFPLLFRVFKPQKRLKSGDTYQTKPALAVELIQELKRRGFTIDLVLADRLYGESSDFITALMTLNLLFVVAIRDNHTIWVKNGTRQRQTRWRPFERVFSDGSSQTRYICEVIFGQRGTVRYFCVTTDPLTLPSDTTCLLMTNLPGNVRHTLGNLYGLRTWIEYGFKQLKNELGWADYRLTDYAAIERWWEIVFSAYFMVSCQTPLFQAFHPVPQPLTATPAIYPPWWDPASGWNATLNHLRLLIQPFVALCLLLPWLTVFPFLRLPARSTN